MGRPIDSTLRSGSRSLAGGTAKESIPDRTSDEALGPMPKIERLGDYIVFGSTGQARGDARQLSIIGGAPEGEPQPMHYFDSRGVRRLYLTAIDGSTWKDLASPGEDWNGPDGRASTSASSARSRPTARRSTLAGSAAWATPATTGSSTSRSRTVARTSSASTCSPGSPSKTRRRRSLGTRRCSAPRRPSSRRRQRLSGRSATPVGLHRAGARACRSRDADDPRRRPRCDDRRDRRPGPRAVEAREVRERRAQDSCFGTRTATNRLRPCPTLDQVPLDGAIRLSRQIRLKHRRPVGPDVSVGSLGPWHYTMA